MKISLADFKERFHDLLLRFLWRQWSALGVAGHSDKKDSWMIDPEALLLFSTVIARLDARLFDEILDWLLKNGSWINLQRLTRLQEERELGDPFILAPIASYLSGDSAHKKWEILTQKALSATGNSKPLFPGVPVLGNVDETFLKWGWQRGSIKPRQLSQSPQMDQPATFLLKLRSLFGRQSRADVIAWLLSHESGHPAEIARQLSYFPRSIQVVLNELALSGHIYAARSGREKHFAIRHEEWRFLITWDTPEPSAYPQWIQWGILFRVLRRFYDLLEQPNLKTMSPSLQAIEIKRALDVASLVKAGLPAHLTHPPSNTGPEFFGKCVHDLEKLIG